MAQPELKTYVDAQLARGVSKEGVKKALLGAGWSAAEIDAALGTSATPATPVTPAKPAGSPAAAPTARLDGVRSVTPPAFTANAQPTSSSGAASSNPFGIQEQRFSFKAPETSGASVNPVSLSSAPVEEGSLLHHSRREHVLAGLAAALIVALAAITAVLYFKNGTLADQLAGLSGVSGETASLQSRIAEFETKNQAVSARLNEVSLSLAEAQNELAVFATSRPTSTVSPTVTVKGLLAERPVTKQPTVTTGNGIVFFVANYRDPRVAEAIKQFSLGSTIEIGGTYTPGFAAITVTHVNGSPIAQAAPPPPPPPPPTSTTTTSTTPAP